MPRTLHPDLRDCLERANPNVQTIVEITSPDVGNVLRRPDQLVGAGSALVAGSMVPANSLAASVGSGLTLAPTSVALASFAGEQSLYDLNAEDPSRRLKGLSWEVDPAMGRALLRSFTARVSRSPTMIVNAVAYYATTVDFELQIYRITKTPGVKTQGDPGTSGYSATAFTEYSFPQVLASAAVIRASSIVWDGANKATLAFDLSQYGVVLESTPTRPSQPDQAGELPRYLFVVRTVNAPKTVSLFHWLTDSGSARNIAQIGAFARSFWGRNADQDQWVETQSADVPTATINVETYPASGQAVYALDLTRAPSPNTTGRVRFEHVEPHGTAGSLELSTQGANGPWAPVSDGDLVAAAQQLYHARVTLGSDPTRRSSPGVLAVGVEFRTPVELSLESSVGLPTREVNIPFCKAAVAEGDVTVIRTGIRDYLDAAGTLASTKPTTKLEADIFLGSTHPSVDRSKWLRLERLSITNRVPKGTSERFTTLSYAAKLKRKIPQQTESINSVHTVQNGSNASSVIVTPALPNATAGGNEYDGKHYYVRVRSTANTAFAQNYQQEIQGNTGVSQLDFNPQLPGALNAGDVVEVHSGAFAPVSLSWQDADPSQVWADIINYAAVPRERVGLGYLPRGGLPPSVADRAPGDQPRQDALRVTLRLAEQTEAQALLDQVSFIMGGVTIELDGQIVFIQIFPLRAADGSITVPLAPIAATFDVRDLAADPGTSPGYEKRASLVQAKYGKNSAATNPDAYPERQTVVVDNDAIAWLEQQDLAEVGAGEIPDEIARWLYNTADSGLTLATSVADMLVRATSTGLRRFTLTAVDAHYNLVPGDSVVLFTDQYTDYDPGSGVSLRGPLAIRGVLVSVGPEGRTLAMFVGGLGENVSRTTGAQPGDTSALDAAPGAPTVQMSFDVDGHPVVTIAGGQGTVSLKFAVSTMGMPSDDDVEAAAAIDSDQTSFTVTSITCAPGEIAILKAFGYSRAGGAGRRSLSAQLPHSREGGPKLPVAVITNNQATRAQVMVTLSLRGVDLTPTYTWRVRAGMNDGSVSVVPIESGSSSSNPLPATANVYPVAAQQGYYVLEISSTSLDPAVQWPLDGTVAGDFTMVQATNPAVNADGNLFIDSVLDSANYQRTTPTQVGGANKANVALTSNNRLATGVEANADIGGINAAVAARAQGTGVFTENWEVGSLDAWGTVNGSAATAFDVVPGGTYGKNHLRVTGANVWVAYQRNIPFDPTKLYRIRFRIANTSFGGQANGGAFYAGIVGLGSNSAPINSLGQPAYSSSFYVAAAGVAFPYNGGNYNTFDGWFKGIDAATSGGIPAGVGTATAPTKLYSGTTYIAPICILNYGGSSGSAEFYVDSVEITEYDDDGTFRTYTLANSDGRVSALQRLPMGKMGGLGWSINGQAWLSPTTFDGANWNANFNSVTATIGGKRVTYPSGEVYTNGDNLSYYVYNDDPNFTGAWSPQFTQTLSDLAAAEGRQYVGVFTTGSHSGGTVTVEPPPPTQGGPGGPQCFPAGTMVTLADGTLCPIEEITNGTLVRAFDPESNRCVTGRVTALLVHENGIAREMLQLIASDGGQVDTTPEHRFYTPACGFVCARDMAVGDEVYRHTANGLARRRLIGVTRAARRAELVYNLTVEHWHTYIANGFAVHNSKPISA